MLIDLEWIYFGTIPGKFKTRRLYQLNSKHDDINLFAIETPTMKTIKSLSSAIALLTLVLIGLGGYVRATGAGLACPDWPLCFGRVVPEDFSGGVTQELVHRYLAGIVGLLTLWLVVCSSKLRTQHRRLWVFTAFLLILVVVQAVFGGLTVTMKLSPLIVTTHLALGTIFFQLMCFIAFEGVLRRKSNPPVDVSPGWAKIVGFFVFLVFFQIVLGGYVGSSGAALACSEFPKCNGEWIPNDLSSPQFLQMLHRITAFILFFFSAALVVAVFSRVVALSTSKALLLIVFLMILVQMGLGTINVLNMVPVHIAVSHLIVAQLILFKSLSIYRRLNGKLWII